MQQFLHRTRCCKQIFLLVCLALTSITHAADSLFTLVERHSLAQIVWQDEEWPRETFYDYLLRCVRYQSHPQEFKKRRSAFKLLATVEQQKQLSQATVLGDTTTWVDLSLFSGPHDAAACLVEKINRTSTTIGRTALACRLAQPITDIAELAKRQRIVRELLNNGELHERIDAIMLALQKAENLMNSFWLADPLQQSAERHYFNLPGATKLNELLNKNAVALDVMSTVNTGGEFAGAAMNAVATVVLPVYAAAYIAGYKPSKDVAEFTNGLVRGGTTYALGYAVVRAFGPEYWESRALREYRLGSMMGDGILYGFSVKPKFLWARDNVIVDMCLQEKLIDVATYVQGLRDLDAAIQANPTLASSLSLAPDLHELFNEVAQRSDELEQLLELLQADTFVGEASAFSRRGNVLVAYKLMHAVKDSFVKAIGAVGELDAYLSVAKLYKQAKTQNNPYCFVDFTTAEQPAIKLKNFWNPFISHSKAVPNSITINGAKGPANVIVTGPNAGGKSTVLKAVAINLILAQTYGIAAAQSMTITPFCNIATYLNIVDDIAAGNSLFKAEVLRAHALVQQVKTLQKGEFSFVAIDEMFSGTSPEEGRAAAYSVAKHLGQYSNNICMIATHFPLLTQLEKDTANFANYRVCVSVDANGAITYPFTLERGISDQHVALDILKAEGFASSIVDDARQLLNRNS